MAELLISELSRRSGVPATTLRYYEQVGVLPAARSHSGYRLYDEHAEQRLRLISAAKRLQMPLLEIVELLTVWEEDACRSVRSHLRPALDARIAEAATGIAALTRLHTELIAARERLDSLPDRDDRCNPRCTVLLEPVTVQGPDSAKTDRPIA
ncbi:MULTISPECIES: MerR family transcriptional regulator [Rhodococcus]|uniref:Putative MerR family transcriptional regulator n=2 Tax=Rhodococcus opacus TaxID=37919 RepID=C1BD20_RHOOB|nr:MULTISPECIES: MerR family transcriptional regulator [Rhodococcus]EID81318.1 putative MerR family transcriptional regulator [Rhodococcus opacus RKJ300 = JCM 13270]KAF0964261.1 HTH-type transcriptional regulator HmrR [Rhodococcus sp. T7]QQZ19248.1 MerR family transcriptional regulator [Rhodococcus sp. 21391]UOT08020.1 MerR family transcriptional regulator [Rhodococcus opacus]BAH55764.1 putative MerR family transcriptional regulator [Rhodococcus opacus B4]